MAKQKWQKMEGLKYGLELLYKLGLVQNHFKSFSDPSISFSLFHFILSSD
jgi:hypothetical protein